MANSTSGPLRALAVDFILAYAPTVENDFFTSAPPMNIPPLDSPVVDDFLPTASPRDSFFPAADLQIEGDFLEHGPPMEQNLVTRAQPGTDDSLRPAPPVK